MYVMNEAETAIYDSSDESCGMWISWNGAGYCAFIQVVVIGHKADPEKPVITKRLWGPFDRQKYAASVRWIMDHGGDWPELPAANKGA